MKNTIQLTLILIAISIISCQKQDEYLIKGNLTGFPDSTMFYLRNLSTDETFDSAMIIAGKFELSGHLQNEPEDIDLVAIIDDKDIFTNLFIRNETVKVNGDITDFPWDVAITGSDTQDDFTYFRNLTKSFDIKKDSLKEDYYNLSIEEQQEKDEEIWDEIEQLDDTIRSLRIGYVKSHINTYPGIIFLGYFMRSFPKDTVQVLYDKLSDEIKASKYAKIVKVFLNEKIADIGDSYHDFKAINKDGDTINFSDLSGKYILLEFTTAYCGGCIQAARNLNKVKNTICDSVTIVSFYCDNNKDNWLMSINRENISWNSLWDGKGRYSETFIKYGVPGFPSFYLINPQGVIVDKGGAINGKSIDEMIERFLTKL